MYYFKGVSINSGIPFAFLYFSTSLPRILSLFDHKRPYLLKHSDFCFDLWSVQSKFRDMEEIYKTVSESVIRISQLMLPSNANFGGKIHGGYILSLMDQIAFAVASKFSAHYCVTASVGKVDFLKPIEVGELVTLIASVNYVGNSSMEVGIRVEAMNIQTGETKHCNSSYFTMVAKDETGKPARVHG